MRRLLSQSASLILALMLATAFAPQARQNRDDSPNQPGGNQSEQDRRDQPDPSKAPGQKDQSDSPGPQPPGDKDSGGWSSSSSSPAGQANGPPQELPKYNPLPAEQDVEVGAYYMHKGNADAAIGRFQDAIQLKADYAKPRLLLAQIYEKKGDKASAVKYYKEYLQVYPHAPDAKKVQAKIEKLSAR